MDIYERKLNQDQINTNGFWTRLFEDAQSKNILAVTEKQISAAVNAKILTQEQGNELKRRKETMTTAIRRESLKRYPVQVPRKSAQQTYSDKYKKEMSDSKRKRKQNLYGTDLHRKKLNALDVERAESEHQNEKTSLIARFMNTVQTSYPALLRGKSVEDIMSEPEISDRAEFLVDDEAHIFGNLNILFGERLEVVGQECVRQFMQLDLSADLRTDKALAKDAERLEKVTSKARAMINLVDNHPEIEFSAFSVSVDEKWSPSEIEQLRNMELDVLRSYKKILGGEVEFLKQKYGCGLRLENPIFVLYHRSEMDRDIGSTQTITEIFDIFRKYGIMDINDPADLEMEATIWYLHFSSSAAGIATTEAINAGILPSYTDMMRRYALGFQRLLNQTDLNPSIKIRINELEGNMDGNLMVRWGMKASYADA